MADSNQDKQIESNFDDDLERMLQDTEEMSAGDEILDDEDAIERLLEESQETVQTESVDDLVDSLLDDVATEQKQTTELGMEEIDEFAEEDIDEFGEEPLEQLSTVTSSDDSIDELLQTAQESGSSSDEEFDEFADDDLDDFIESHQTSKPAPVVNVQEEDEEVMSEIDEFADDEDSDEDFLLADFDISADVEEQATADVAAKAEKSAVTIAPEPVNKSVDYSGEINAQNERIKQLEAGLSALQQSPDFTEALDKIVSDQKKVNKSDAEASKKLKILSIAGLVIGILALIVAVVVVVLNSGVQSNLGEVQNTMMDIEDRLAIPLVDPNNKKIDTLQASIESLETENKLLLQKLTQLEEQAADKNTEADELLRAEVNQQLLEMAEKISLLEANMASAKIQNKKLISTRKTVREVKVSEWVVNLVSFKQRWYTDKKIEEFKQKGIPSEVIVVDVNGVQWYRIRVTGFKSKAEADLYAAKVKKSLNLSSVWVSAK